MPKSLRYSEAPILEALSMSKVSLFSTESSPDSAALRRRLWELTEDHVEPRFRGQISGTP
ncbi:MAG: hypothetical protein IIB90_18565 [Gemmatimonadetes bacterium]|nr:hypothetical protein [Gemmatimonadota bacterium]